MKSTIQTFRKSSNSYIKRRVDVDDVVYDAIALTVEHPDPPPSIQETLRENLLNRWREAKLLSVIFKNSDLLTYYFVSSFVEPSTSCLRRLPSNIADPAANVATPSNPMTPADDSLVSGNALAAAVALFSTMFPSALADGCTDCLAAGAASVVALASGSDLTVAFANGWAIADLVVATLAFSVAGAAVSLGC